MAFKKYHPNSRVMEDLKKRSYLGIFFYMAAISLVLFPDGFYWRNLGFSSLFFSLMAGICTVRFCHRIAERWMGPSYSKLNDRIFFVSIFVTALVWGGALVKFVLMDGEIEAGILMIMVTVGLDAGGVMAFYPSFRLAAAFNFLMLIPTIFVMFFFGIEVPLAVTLTLMYIYLNLIAFRGNREYWQALENEYLLEEKSKEFEKISQIDGLTGLYNRRYFDELYAFEWNRSLRRKTPISVILADIDHFKQVNDRYGHPAGDEYLKAVSRVLEQVFRRKIDIIARYGGEEFIILLSDESGENAGTLARETCSRVEACLMEYEGRIIRTTLSLGVACAIPKRGQERHTLISQADQALYQSKAGGRNRVTIIGP